MKRKRDSEIEVVTRTHRYFVNRNETFSAFNNSAKIYFCESCLRLFCRGSHLLTHSEMCSNAFWIPGCEIYRSSTKRICIFEIDGRRDISSAYLRRLCIFTKLFLNDKVTLDDVHFFVFTALFEVDDFGFHFAGYFSKELQGNKGSSNTLSCIMILPPFESKGYGSFLAELSYEFGRRQLSTGTPERPLSWSGKRLFRKIWREECLRAIFLNEEKNTPTTVNSVCKASGLIFEDALIGLHESKVLWTFGRQGPIIVVDNNSFDCMKQRRYFQHCIEWESTI